MLDQYFYVTPLSWHLLPDCLRGGHLPLENRRKSFPKRAERIYFTHLASLVFLPWHESARRILCLLCLSNNRFSKRGETRLDMELDISSLGTIVAINSKKSWTHLLWINSYVNPHRESFWSKGTSLSYSRLENIMFN